MPNDLEQSDWSQFDTVTPEANDHWAGFETIEPEQLTAPTEPMVPTKSDSTLRSLRNLSVKDAFLGAGEALLTGVSSIAGLARGGLQGIEGEINRIPEKPERWTEEQYAKTQQGISQKPTAVGRISETVEGALEDTTYEPRTVQGQATMMGLQDTASQVSRAVTGSEIAKMMGAEETEMPLYDLAFGVGAPDDTFGAAMAYTALTAATFALGEGVLSRKRAPRGKSKAGSDKIDTAYRKLESDINTFYREADAAGGGVKAEHLAGARNDVVARLTDEGYDPDIHPGAAKALKVIEDAAGSNHTLKGMEITRKKLNGAMSLAVRNSKEDARMAGIVREIYDDYYTDIPDNMYIGEATNANQLYPRARQLASQKFKADEITWAIERARLRSGQFTGSGFDNALKTEFRQILMNPKRRRMFNEIEIELLDAIVDGSFAQRAASAVGRFAGRGPVSMALTGGIGAATFGPIGAIAAIAMGESGRQLSTSLRRGAANKAALEVIEGTTRKQ